MSTKTATTRNVAGNQLTGEYACHGGSCLRQLRRSLREATIGEDEFVECKKPSEQKRKHATNLCQHYKSKIVIQIVVRAVDTNVNIT